MSVVAINAKFAGRCRCGRSVWRNQAVQYDTSARRVVSCYDCSHRKTVDPEAPHGRLRDGTIIEVTDLFV